VYILYQSSVINWFICSNSFNYKCELNSSKLQPYL